MKKLLPSARPLGAQLSLPVIALGLALQAAHAQPAPQAPPALQAAPSNDELSAYAAAEAAYKAQEQGNSAEAIELAQRAARLAPRNADYARLLMQVLAAAGRTQEAISAADQVLAIAPGDPTTLAERGRLRAKLGDRAGATSDGEAALAAPGLEPVQRVSVLADLGRIDQARLEYRQVVARPAADATASRDMDMAYLGVRVDEPQLALEAFQRAEKAGQLPASALRDAAYAADHAGLPEVAADYFRRAVDEGAAGRLKLTAQEMFETRRSISELTRRWGVFSSVNYRSGGGATPGFGAISSSPTGASLESGIEAWWRPTGSHDGKYWEVFGRTFQTLESELGASGSQTRQSGIGARVKPLSDQNLVLSLSRVDSRSGGGDWLAQVGYSYDVGTDIRRDKDAWLTWRVNAEAGRYMRRNQNYAVAGAQVGRSFRVNDSDNATIIFPHVGVTADYDSAAANKHSVGMGPGIAVRQWFRGDLHGAPRSYVDFSLQYRAHVSGDQRNKGWFASVLLSY